jgi:hypothetical protein
MKGRGRGLARKLTRKWKEGYGLTSTGSGGNGNGNASNVRLRHAAEKKSFDSEKRRLAGERRRTVVEGVGMMTRHTVGDATSSARLRMRRYGVHTLVLRA